MRCRDVNFFLGILSLIWRRDFFIRDFFLNLGYAIFWLDKLSQILAIRYRITGLCGQTQKTKVPLNGPDFHCHAVCGFNTVAGNISSNISVTVQIHDSIFCMARPYSHLFLVGSMHYHVQPVYCRTIASHSKILQMLPGQTTLLLRFAEGISASLSSQSYC